MCQTQVSRTHAQGIWVTTVNNIDVGKFRRKELTQANTWQTDKLYFCYLLFVICVEKMQFVYQFLIHSVWHLIVILFCCCKMKRDFLSGQADWNDLNHNICTKDLLLFFSPQSCLLLFIECSFIGYIHQSDIQFFFFFFLFDRGQIYSHVNANFNI